MEMIISIIIVIAVLPMIDVVCQAYNLDNSHIIIFSIDCLLLAIVVTAVLYLGRIFARSNLGEFLLMLLSLGIGLIFGVVCSLITFNIEGTEIYYASIIFSIVLNMLLAWIIQKVFYISIQEFSGVFVFITVSILYVASALIGWISGVELSTLSMIKVKILFLMFCILYGFLLNRSNLESIIHRRKQNIESVPKNIFGYNAIVTIAICCIPIPLLLLSDMIGTSLYNLLITIFNIIVYIGKSVTSLFSSDSQEVETVEETSKGTLQQVVTESSNKWDILFVIIIILVIYILYRNYEIIIGKFREIFQNVVTKFKRSSPDEQRIEIASDDGYTDIVTNIDTIGNKYTPRLFRRDYRKYMCSKTSTDTIMFGFHTLIKGLNLLHYDIRPSDTVSDVSHKFDCKNFTNIYQCIRYDTATPNDRDRKILDDLLKQIYRQLHLGR